MDIRRATPDDAGAIACLNVEVQAIYAQAQPRLFKRPARPGFSAPFFAEVLANPDHYAFIAYERGEPVGYIYAQQVLRAANPFRHAQRLLYIHHLCVTRERRGRGLGKALVARALTLAGELGIERVELDVWSFNEPARAAFAALGFAVYNERMCLEREAGALHVVTAEEADIPAWLELAAEVEPLFGPMVEEPGFLATLRQSINEQRAFCVREGGGPPGMPLMGGLLFATDPPAYKIGWLAVAGRHQRRGVGRLLVEHAIRRVQPPAEISLTTFSPDVAEGEPARRFYERMGFYPAEPAPPGPEGGSRQVYRRSFAGE